jgi:triphosphoribosyl-dephospho-CoA synthase
VTACKPGNVTRFLDFDDVTYLDFIASAAAIAPILGNARQRRVGELVLEAVEATRRVVTTNTNLGIVLLLAPLALVPEDLEVSRGIESVLAGLDVADARAVYQAIRTARPSGLGRVTDQDLFDEPTESLRHVMGLAADRDLVARQYANGFREILEDGVPSLMKGLEETKSIEGAIMYCHLDLMAKHPDSLIARKRGEAEATRASRKAKEVLDEGWPNERTGCTALAELDGWLRAEGHSRNPGTTADLVTACLFVALREGRITLPPRYPWPIEFPS